MYVAAVRETIYGISDHLIGIHYLHNYNSTHYYVFSDRQEYCHRGLYQRQMRHFDALSQYFISSLSRFTALKALLQWLATLELICDVDWASNAAWLFVYFVPLFIIPQLFNRTPQIYTWYFCLEDVAYYKLYMHLISEQTFFTSQSTIYNFLYSRDKGKYI